MEEENKIWEKDSYWTQKSKENVVEQRIRECNMNMKSSMRERDKLVMVHEFNGKRTMQV